jgi:ABC-2 type transport system ATP-binding protein
VVLDEPTVGLDPIQIREIRSLIRELGADHGIILSTHILPEVQATCTRVQIIHEGKLVFADTTAGLEQGPNTTSFTVRFENTPALATLQQIAGVDRAEALADGRFRIHHADNNPVEALLELAVSNHWRLTELAPEHHTLEQIFIDLTCSEEPVATRGDAAR